MADTKAIKKLKELVAADSEASIAKKLGIARGTLLGLMAGRTLPRIDVANTAKKYGIRHEDWI